MFSALLHSGDAKRASDVVEELLASGLRACALTGGLAVAAQLRAHGRAIGHYPLNDIDLVVERFGAIPAALAGRFVLNHIHPSAPGGKMLLQLIDRERVLRVDLFRTLGRTLPRARVVDRRTQLPVVAVEDLVARNTAHVCGRLRRNLDIDAKHVRAFMRLARLGRPTQLTEAWRDHRGDMPGTLEEATQEIHQLLARHPELVVTEKYAAVPIACDRCENYGPFRLAPPEMVVDILGYW